jgi:transcriptional regulator with XRE-family HTH domain
MLGQKLKQVREENGFSQADIAKKLGKNQNTISSWEVGRTQPKLKDLHTLCGIYGCTYEYLTGTKQHDSKDVTYDDIVSKLWDFDIDRLHDLKHHIDMVIHNQEEIIRIEMEKAKLQSHILEYQRRLNELKQAENPPEGGSGGQSVKG